MKRGRYDFIFETLTIAFMAGLAYFVITYLVL